MGNCNFSSKDEDTEEILSAKAFAVTQLNEIAIFSRLKEEDLTEIVETIYHPDEDIVVQGDEHTDLIYVLRNGVCDYICLFEGIQRNVCIHLLPEFFHKHRPSVRNSLTEQLKPAMLLRWQN